MFKWLYCKRKTLILILLLIAFVISITFNILHFMKVSKLKKKYNTENLSKEELELKVKEIDDSLEETKSTLSRVKRVAKIYAQRAEMLRIYITELAATSELDRKSYNTNILGHSDVYNAIQVLNTNYDQRYVDIMKNKYGDTTSYLAFKYPETEEEYNKIKSKYEESYLRSEKEIDTM